MNTITTKLLNRNLNETNAQNLADPSKDYFIKKDDACTGKTVTVPNKENAFGNILEYAKIFMMQNWNEKPGDWINYCLRSKGATLNDNSGGENLLPQENKQAMLANRSLHQLAKNESKVFAVSLPRGFQKALALEFMMREPELSFTKERNGLYIFNFEAFKTWLETKCASSIIGGKEAIKQIIKALNKNYFYNITKSGDLITLGKTHYRNTLDISAVEQHRKIYEKKEEINNKITNIDYIRINDSARDVTQLVNDLSLSVKEYYHLQKGCDGSKVEVLPHDFSEYILNPDRLDSSTKDMPPELVLFQLVYLKHQKNPLLYGSEANKFLDEFIKNPAHIKILKDLTSREYLTCITAIVGDELIKPIVATMSNYINERKKTLQDGIIQITAEKKESEAKARDNLHKYYENSIRLKKCYENTHSDLVKVKSNYENALLEVRKSLSIKQNELVVVEKNLSEYKLSNVQLENRANRNSHYDASPLKTNEDYKTKHEISINTVCSELLNNISRILLDNNTYFSKSDQDKLSLILKSSTKSDAKPDSIIKNINFLKETYFTSNENDNNLDININIDTDIDKYLLCEILKNSGIKCEFDKFYNDVNDEVKDIIKKVIDIFLELAWGLQERGRLLEKRKDQLEQEQKLAGQTIKYLNTLEEYKTTTAEINKLIKEEYLKVELILIKIADIQEKINSNTQALDKLILEDTNWIQENNLTNEFKKLANIPSEESYDALSMKDFEDIAYMKMYFQNYYNYARKDYDILTQELTALEKETQLWN